MWPPVALASTTVTLDATFSSISVTAWIIVWVLSTMGGLTSLLHRLKSATPKKLLTYVASHMVMAWFAGGMSFFLMESIGIPDMLEMLLIAVLAYSGSRFVDNLTERVSKWTDTQLSKVLGEQK
jgi:hypothetical protein